MRIVIRQTLTVFFVFISITSWGQRQKVGVVLSGGGASGIAHVGVLKALEENNIPIDYITGTSVGAFVGAMYAVGYSPAQIEALLLSEQFRNMAYGKIEDEFAYYYKKREDDASWVSVKLSLDTAIETNLPTNVISPYTVDFGLMELLAPAAALADYKFDSLFIPFRCVAADIEQKQPVVFKDGDLAQAVRASMSYPFYLKPIKVNGKLLFDGGIYNNFPSNIMYDDFFPDMIIGSNVTGNAPAPDQDNVLSQIKVMMQSKTNYDITCQNGVIVEPQTDIGLFDFDEPAALIDSGYAACMRQMPLIKKRVQTYTTFEELAAKRTRFSQHQQPLIFDHIIIEGLNKKQSFYVKQQLSPGEKEISLKKLKKSFFRLAADEKIKEIYPIAIYNKEYKKYDLFLNARKAKSFTASVGGNFSNRPISEGYFGVQYNYLGRVGVSIAGNSYFGKLYTSAQVRSRLDFPFRIPFFIEPSITFNRWDFYRSSNAFFEDVKPAYLISQEEYGELSAGIPMMNHSKIVAGSALAYQTQRYYQTENFSVNDTTDRTQFNSFTSYMKYQRNTFNRKQYPSAGSNLVVQLRYVQGEEFTEPGSKPVAGQKNYRAIHEWIALKGIIDKYLIHRGPVRIGLYAEGVFSTQSLFSNYTASILAAPAFQPLPESKTLFQEKYRAFQYVAAGLKLVVPIRAGFEFRGEGYMYQPYQVIVKQADLKADLANPLNKRYLLGMAALVFHSPIGPISISVNYYDQEVFPFSFLFHAGFILFNRKALD